MQGDEQRCEHCGSPLALNDAFCGGCGRPVPARKRRPSARLTAAIVILVLLNSLIYLGVQWIARPVPQPSPPAQPAEAERARPPAQQPGDEFLGDWYLDSPEDPSDPANTLVVRREGAILVGRTRRSRHADRKPYHLELQPAAGGDLKGRYVPETGDPFPATAELTSGRSKLVIELAPPASEYFTSVFIRAGREEADSGGVSTGPAVNPGELDGQRALDLVTARPEVQAFLSRARAAGREAHAQIDRDEEELFSVHVFELRGQGAQAHLSTFNWYEVGKKSGQVTPGLPPEKA